MARAIRTGIGSQIRAARTSAGLSLRAAAGAVGLDFSTFSRIERGQLETVTVLQLALACAAVGLDLSVRTYPRGDPVRDAAQLRLLGRLRKRLPATAVWQTEVPMPIPGDLRALDARTRLGETVIGFEAETQLQDIQAMTRRLALKKRDASIDLLILIVADTVRNRRALELHGEALRGSFPLDTRAVLGPLGRGEAPKGDGIVIL